MICLVHILRDTVLYRYGSTEQARCGKATLEPLLNEPCEPAQVINLSLFADTLTTFTEMFILSFIRVVIESDHMAGDTGEYRQEQARLAGEAFHSASQGLIDIVKGRDEDTMNKVTYYEALFHIQDTLLPAIKGVETTFGDRAPSIQGTLYSEAVTEFLSFA